MSVKATSKASSDQTRLDGVMCPKNYHHGQMIVIQKYPPANKPGFFRHAKVLIPSRLPKRPHKLPSDSNTALTLPSRDTKPVNRVITFSANTPIPPPTRMRRLNHKDIIALKKRRKTGLESMPDEVLLRIGNLLHVVFPVQDGYPKTGSRIHGLRALIRCNKRLHALLEPAPYSSVHLNICHDTVLSAQNMDIARLVSRLGINREASYDAIVYCPRDGWQLARYGDILPLSKIIRSLLARDCRQYVATEGLKVRLLHTILSHPAIRTLVIGSRHKHAQSPGGSEDSVWEGDLAHVRNLGFGKVEPDVLAKLVRCTPKLSVLYVPSGYECSPYTGQIRAMRTHTSLRILQIATCSDGYTRSVDVPASVWSTGFLSLQSLTLDSSAIDCECKTGFDVSLSSHSYHLTNSSPDLQLIVIPPLPKLRHLVYNVRFDHEGSTGWGRRVWERPWTSAQVYEEEDRHIRSHGLTVEVIAKLRAAPSLEIIHFTSIFESRVEENIAKWCESSINGILIRSYFDHVSGDEFFHTRRLRLEALRPGRWRYEGKVSLQSLPVSVRLERLKTPLHSSLEGTCQGDGKCVAHYWENITNFRGHRVPEEVLKRVYMAMGGESGDDISWKMPGRDLEMPQASWAVLREWYDQSGKPMSARIPQELNGRSS
jgi:hypothetical protein